MVEDEEEAEAGASKGKGKARARKPAAEPEGEGRRVQLKGTVHLQDAWRPDGWAAAPLFKKAPATRKKAYIDLLLTKEKQLKGASSEIHEAGFAAIYAILEGRDVSCPVCLCTITEPTVTPCAHAFCK